MFLFMKRMKPKGLVLAGMLPEKPGIYPMVCLQVTLLDGYHPEMYSRLTGSKPRPPIVAGNVAGIQ